MKQSILIAAFAIFFVGALAVDVVLNPVNAYKCGFYCSDCLTQENELKQSDCSPATHFGTTASCLLYCPPKAF